MSSACAVAIVTGSIGQAYAADLTLSSIGAGQVSIAVANPQTTIITQSTDKALINWTDFSIASGSSVQFLQPGATSIALNRVLGPAPSLINGNLLANGQVWLINGNGVLFGSNAQVNVGGLIATTADMHDADFLSSNYLFSIASTNPKAGVQNSGTIRASSGGSVVLAGAGVSNSGLIQADLGKAVLAGGSKFSVDFSGDNLLRFAITAPATAAPENEDGTAKPSLVSNSGTISAQGGRVVMTARAASNIVDNVINNTGMIQAISAFEKDGEIILDGGEDGAVRAGGTLDASGTDSGNRGGMIEITGNTIHVEDGAVLDASGDTGGGTILVGGNLRGAGPQQNARTTNVGTATLKADAGSAGNGGTIVAWSDGSTSFAGGASAKGGAAGGNGGLVETSGHKLVLSPAVKVDTSAPSGVTGTWLLDPDFISIQVGGGTPLPPSGTLAVTDHPGLTDFVTPATIVTALGTTNVMLQAFQDINVFSPVVYSSTNSLTLLAGRNVSVKADIQNQQATGGGAINVIGGWDRATVNLGSLTNFGVFGNNNGNVQVGLPATPGNVAVGSLSGTTTVAGRSVMLDSMNGNAQIGYRGVGRGNIFVSAVLDVAQVSPLALAFTLIGNGGTAAAGSTGDVTIDAATFINLSSSVANDLVGGNVTIRARAPTPFAFDKPISYNGAGTLTVLAAGDLSVANSIQNSGMGAINLVAGWDQITTSLATVLVNPTAYGNNNGTIVVGGNAAVGRAAVGSAGGALTLATNNVSLDAVNGYAQVGYHGAGGGTISILAKNNIRIQAQTTDPARFAQIGNGSFAKDITGNVTGDIFLRSGASLEFLDSIITPPGAYGWIGNVTGGGTKTGNLTILASRVSDNGGSRFGDMLKDAAGITGADPGGNVFLGFTETTSPSGGLVIDKSAGLKNFNSPNSLTVASMGNILLADTIYNAGTGTLAFVAGWDGTTTNTAHMANAGVFGSRNAGITIGSGTATGNVAIGTAGGTTTLLAHNLKLDAINGYAQLGAHGASTGIINVTTLGDVILNSGVTAGYFTQIGNGGFLTAANEGGNISITTGAGIQLKGGSAANTYALIGNGDLLGTGTISGNITINTTGAVTLAPGTGTNAYTRISNLIGTGTVSGTLTGYTPPVVATIDQTNTGTITTLLAPTTFQAPIFQPGNNPRPLSAGNVMPPPLQNAGGPPGQQGGPIQELEGPENPGNPQRVADVLSKAVVESVTNSKPSNRVTIISGLLQQVVTPVLSNPTAVPPADEQSSSWGNEALWQ